MKLKIQTKNENLQFVDSVEERGRKRIGSVNSKYIGEFATRNEIEPTFSEHSGAEMSHHPLVDRRSSHKNAFTLLDNVVYFSLQEIIVFSQSITFLFHHVLPNTLKYFHGRILNQNHYAKYISQININRIRYHSSKIG